MSKDLYLHLKAAAKQPLGEGDCSCHNTLLVEVATLKIKINNLVSARQNLQ